MRQLAKRALLCLSLALLLTLTGCWNSIEINNLALVMGIGIDPGDVAGEYLITMQIANPSAIVTGAGGSSQPGGQSYLNLQHQDIGIYPAMAELTRITSRKLFTLQDQVLIVDQQVAAQGLSDVLDYFVRSVEGQYSTSLLIAENKASAVLDATTTLEKLPASHIRRMVETQRWSGEIAQTTIFYFLEDFLGQGIEPVVPLVDLYENAAGDLRPILTGMAVFQDGRMVGTLNPEQSRALLLLRERTSTGTLTFQGLGGYISLELITTQASYQPRYENGSFSMHVALHQLYKVVNTTSREDLEDGANEARMIALAQETLYQQLADAILHAQSLGADIFGFGQAIYRKYPGPAKPFLEQWNLHFQSLPITLEVDVRISGTGTIMLPIHGEEAPYEP